MENFDKIKVFITKCIKRKYDNSKITFTNDNNIYQLDIRILTNSPTKQLECVCDIEEVLKLCHIKEDIKIRVNDRNRLFIHIDVISENLGKIKKKLDLSTPVITTIQNSSYGIHCNTDPIW
jgi:hypothetical protein